MILKYTLRLIKSTFNRFLAIVAIVFIGVSFMMGLRSNYDIMKNSVEKYIDEQKLYDIQIYSNYGFDESDVKTIENIDCVSEVYPSKTRDVYSIDPEGLVLSTRILEVDSNLNKIELEEGRMPEKENECLLISGYIVNPINIGDEIETYLNAEDIKDSFKNTKYTIVGIAKSGEYMSETYSTSLIDNTELNIIIYIPNSNFLTDYYTCLYVKLDGVDKLDSFSDEYRNLVDEDNKIVSSFSSSQSKERRNKIVNEATEELNKSKAEFEEKKAEYEKEIKDAKKQLDDAKKQLNDAKKQIEENEAKIPDAEEELKEGQKQIDKGWKELNEKQKQLDDAVAEIESYGVGVDEAVRIANRINDIYTETINEKASLEKQKTSLEAEKQAHQNNIDKYNNEHATNFTDAEQVSAEMELLDPESQDYKDLSALLDEFNSLSSINSEISRVDIEYNTISTSLEEAERLAKEYFEIESIEAELNKLLEELDQLTDGQKLIDDAKKQLNDAQKQVDDGYDELEKGIAQLEDAKKQYQDGLKEYNKGLEKYNSGKEEFDLEMQNAQDQIDDAEEQIKSLEEPEWTILNRYDTDYSIYMYENTCEQMKSIGTVIPLLFFVVAALVCSTTMTRLIDEQRGQIGTYRALGFRKGEIINIYILYVIIASLLASFVAVFAGVAIFPNIIYSTWRLMYDLPDIILSMPLDDLLLCVFSFTTLMMIVTLIVINKSLVEEPSQLLRPKAPKSAKKTIIEKWSWFWNKLGFTTKITARNILRYKARFIMTVIGVAGCTSLLLLGWAIKDSITSLVSLQYGKIEKYNYSVNIENDRHLDQIISDIKKDDNNEIYLEYSIYRSEIEIENKNKAIYVRVTDKNRAYSTFGIYDYKTEEPIELTDNGVLISDKFADRNNINIGDEISISSYTGTVKKFKVEGIFVNYTSDYLFISTNLYEKTFNEDVTYTEIAVINNGDTSNLFALKDKYNDVNTIADIESSTTAFNNMLEALNLIIIIIILVAGALAFVVLINLTNVNISERIREIATLKVLGFRDKEVNRYIFKEVFLMSVVGAIIGLPLGKIEERYVMTVIDMDICKFPNIVYPISYVYSFVVTIIFTIIVLLLTRKTLRKVEMVESLKSIE